MSRPDVAAPVLVVIRIVMSIARPHDAAVWRRREKPFRRLEVVVQLVVELFEKLVPHRHECRGGVHHEHQTQHDCVPAGEPNANGGRRPPRRHGSPSLKTNPTPRTVWMSRSPESTSTFLRSRVICTSITLSSGV